MMLLNTFLYYIIDHHPVITDHKPESTQPLIRTVCHHVFHRECLLTWMASTGSTNKYDHDDCPACRHTPLYDTEVYRAVLAAEYPHLVMNVGGGGDSNTDTAATSSFTRGNHHHQVPQPSVAAVPDHHDGTKRCIVYWLVLAFLMQLPLFGIAFREQQRLRNLQRHPPHQPNPSSTVPPPDVDVANIDYDGDHDSSNTNNTATTIFSANQTTTLDEYSTSSCDDFLVYYPSWQALEEQAFACAPNPDRTCRICPSDDDRDDDDDDDHDDFLASPHACYCYCRHELPRTAVYDASTKCCECGAAAAAGNP
jgi:hypothetical protein